MTLLKENLEMQHNEPNLLERFISSGSYLTVGLIGMVWFLVNFFIIKKPMSKFLMYNIIQSFVISIIYAIITTAYNIFIDLFIAIPFIGGIFRFMHNLLFATPIFNTMSLINFILLIFFIYLALFPLFGKLPFIPFITTAAKNLLS